MPKNQQRLTRTAYVDIVDFLHELGEGFGGVTLYCSQEDLLRNEACAAECGIYKVSVKVLETARPPLSYELMDLSPYDESLPAICGSLIKRYKIRIASFEAEIERLQNMINEHNQKV